MCPRFPYPLEKGDKLRMYHQLKLLGQMYEVTLLTLADDDVPAADLDAVRKLVSDVKIYRLSKLQVFLSLFSSLFSGLPLQVMYYYDRKVATKIAADIQSIAPDHIYCQLARMAEYAKDLAIPMTIDYMDAFGVGMERRAATSSWLTAKIYKFESRRMQNYEKSIYKYFDRHVVISDQDAAHISDKKITTIPNGIDTTHFQPQEKTKNYDIGFVGNMGYPPNVDAAEYLVNEIMPLLRSDIRVVIAGARPAKRVKLLANKNVEVTGWVEDVRNAYAKTKVFVAPLWLGTGQQNKILEAMAMGIPCVTSRAVNNAIGAIDGQQILVADNEKEFCQKIELLLSDKILYNSIRNNALTFVQETYSWKGSVNKLSVLFDMHQKE